MQIIAEGRGLILSAKGQRISMCLDDAKNLQRALSEACLVLEEKIKNESAVYRLFREELASADQRWTEKGDRKSCFDAIDAFSDGMIDRGFEILLNANGFSLAYDAITALIEVDLEGWVIPSENLSLRSYPAICHLAASAPADHVLFRMWTDGCFDSFLLEAAGLMAPEHVPSSLHARLFGILAQESHVPSGEFSMGSDGVDSWHFEGPVHKVKFSHDYSVMRFPMSQFLYWMITGENPSLHIGASRPVERISWKDAVNFCIQYSISQGLEPAYSISEDEDVLLDPSVSGYRLPTEAEWECAAKAWTESKFAGSEDPLDVAWFKENSDGRTQVVGLKKENSLGLYDMSGNIWEWCQDYYSPKAYGEGSDRNDPLGPDSGSEHVCRGGGYGSPIESGHLSIRGRFPPETKWEALGFRMVRTVQGITSEEDPL